MAELSDPERKIDSTTKIASKESDVKKTVEREPVIMVDGQVVAAGESQELLDAVLVGVQSLDRAVRNEYREVPGGSVCRPDSPVLDVDDLMLSDDEEHEIAGVTGSYSAPSPISSPMAGYWRVLAQAQAEIDQRDGAQRAAVAQLELRQAGRGGDGVHAVRLPGGHVSP